MLSGKRWTAEEHVLLVQLNATGNSDAAIATRIGRSVGGIRSRLNHIADGTVPQTVEMRRTLALRTPSKADTTAAKRVARHAPPVAVLTRSTRGAAFQPTSPQTPSAALAVCHISSAPRAVPALHEIVTTQIREALDR